MSDKHAILIVDSNPGFASLLKESLEQEGGHRVLLATNGDDALRALSVNSYSLAIVDLGLENPDGITLVRTMREQQGDLRLMLIPLQGEELPAELADLSVQGVLPKPFFLPELPDRIADALANSVGAVGSVPAAPAAPAAPPEPAAEPAPEPARGDKGKKAKKAEDTSADPRVTQQLPVQEELAAGAEPMSAVREHIPQIVENMNGLAQDVNAAAVLLTCKGRLLSHTGQITVEETMGLAQAATENWRTASRVAEILGQNPAQFEQSTEGSEHVFYSLTIVEDIILSVALNANAPLGMIRHRAKGAADSLRTLLGGPA